MRIAVFFDLPNGGARYALYKILENISKDNTVDIYTYEQPKSLTNFADISSHIYLYPLIKLSNLNQHLARLIGDIYSIFFVPFKEKHVANLINNRRYNLVIVNHTRHSQAPSILRYLKGNVIFLCQEPTRAFFENDLLPDSKLPWYNRIYERTVRNIKKKLEIVNAQYPKVVVANSKFSQAQIKKAYGVDSHVAYMGVDTREFYNLHSSKQNEIIVVGNDEPQKNLRLAVDTIAKLPILNRPYLHIVNPRADRLSQLHQYAKDKRVKLRVSTTVNLQSLRQIYNEAICTLCVAKNEPFGLSAIESMACGTPVVAIDEGGFHETIEHGVTGYLSQKDPRELANYISKVKQINSQDCIDYVKLKFSWENTVNIILKLS